MSGLGPEAFDGTLNQYFEGVETAGMTGLPFYAFGGIRNGRWQSWQLDSLSDLESEDAQRHGCAVGRILSLPARKRWHPAIQ